MRRDRSGGRRPRRGQRERVASRLATLRNLEAVNVVLFAGVFVRLWAASGFASSWGFRAYALAVVIAILIQGTLYWGWKVRALRERRPLPRSFAPLFLRFRALNVVLLAFGALLGPLLRLAGPSDDRDLILGGLLLGFAGLEHVNYFVVQLSHDTRADIRRLLRDRALREAPLATDLRRAAPGSLGRRPA